MNTSLDDKYISIAQKGIINRIQDLQKQDNENREHLFALMDSFLRDYKAYRVYTVCVWSDVPAFFNPSISSLYFLR
ncbi:MAG: hypothetical protein WD607_02605 [Candidatus Paceibacterota bacterium]